MAYAMRQVTDGIHETVYLSNLEAQLVATPYFYRLHDVYQSSTVYMTYPSNRTKRYEHCLGTMKIASDMLFAAITNAEPSVRDNLYQQLLRSMKEILRRAVLEAKNPDVGYYAAFSDMFNSALDEHARKEISRAIESGGDLEKIFGEFGRLIDRGMRSGCLSDSALDHYQIAPSQSQTGELAAIDASMRLFLHKCLIEAIRLVALFHDVGHPPYSHVIESVLNRLYDEVHVSGSADAGKSARRLRDSLNQNKVRRLENCLSKYRQDPEHASSPYPMLLQGEFHVPGQLHENVGLAFFHAALLGIVKDEIDRAARFEDDPACKVTAMLFDICVFEFSIAILEEKDETFASLHSIVDGTIDADRLDYVARDPKNSGMAKNGIPYRRLLDSVRLIDGQKVRSIKALGQSGAVPDGFFALAFPSKVTSEISDLLIERYKIFAHINWHHRVLRTASTLQDAVYFLALDYLSSTPDENGDDPCINPEIHMLWDALGSQIGDSEMRVIQWNDSWLINVLQVALVKLSDERHDKNGASTSDDGEGQAENQLLLSHEELLRNLEEILLNKRKFYGFIKRDEDVRGFVKRIFDRAGITREILLKQQRHEVAKHMANTAEPDADEELGAAEASECGGDDPPSFIDNPASDAQHSMNHIYNLLRVMDTLDLQLLGTLGLSGELSLQELIEHELAKMKDKGNSGHAQIADFSVRTNDDRNKIGIPLDDGYRSAIYLYDEFGYFLFDTRISLMPQLEAMRTAVPWMQVYIAPLEGESFDRDFSDYVMDELASTIGESLKQRFDSLYRRRQ